MSFSLDDETNVSWPRLSTKTAIIVFTIALACSFLLALATNYVFR
jgi:hypothetical protein